jgi:hypothetical protein
MHTRAAVAAAAVRMDAAHLGQQLAISCGAAALRPLPPRVVAAGADLEHGTHHPNEEDVAVVIDEPEPHFGGPEKMLIVFLECRAPSGHVRVPSADDESRSARERAQRLRSGRQVWLAS